MSIRGIRFAVAMCVASSLIVASTVSRAEIPPGNIDCHSSTTPIEPLRLTANLEGGHRDVAVVDQREGGLLSGSLIGSSGAIPGALLCIFSRVLSDDELNLMGIAVTRPDGSYRFALPPGPSRSFTIVFQSPNGRLSTSVVLKTRVRPSLRAQPNPAHNTGFVRFSGRIPGSHSRRVTVVLQASGGKQWYDFRHTSTRRDGRFFMRYFFNRTVQPTTYFIRAQVLGAPGYPYEAGNSREIPPAGTAS